MGSASGFDWDLLLWTPYAHPEASQAWCLGGFMIFRKLQLNQAATIPGKRNPSEVAVMTRNHKGDETICAGKYPWRFLHFFVIPQA